MRAMAIAPAAAVTGSRRLVEGRHQARRTNAGSLHVVGQPDELAGSVPARKPDVMRVEERPVGGGIPERACRARR